MNTLRTLCRRWEDDIAIIRSSIRAYRRYLRRNPEDPYWEDFAKRRIAEQEKELKDFYL